jgi:hypothetical protein
MISAKEARLADEKRIKREADLKVKQEKEEKIRIRKETSRALRVDVPRILGEIETKIILSKDRKVSYFFYFTTPQLAVMDEIQAQLIEHGYKIEREYQNYVCSYGEGQDQSQGYYLNITW